jgi:hypothetical protein
MKRYFGTIDTALGNISSVVRNQYGILITNLQNETEQIGTEDIPLWDRSDIANFPVKYNGILTTTRQVALLPESTSLNTLITKDGLILVINGTALTVTDLFDNGIIPYDGIVPVDYTILTYYALNINPQHKRVFSISGKDGNNNLLTKYLKIYNEGTKTYFQTDMDLDLQTDNYGYYGIETESFVEEVSEFNLIKKQFYLIEAPAGTTVFYKGAAKNPVTDNFYWFNDLDIDSTDNYITFQLRNSSVTSGTIIIY